MIKQYKCDSCYCIVFITFLLASKPAQHDKKQKKKDSGFKTGPDGRLIITESSDEEGKIHVIG